MVSFRFELLVFCRTFNSYRKEAFRATQPLMFISLLVRQTFVLASNIEHNIPFASTSYVRIARFGKPRA